MIHKAAQKLNPQSLTKEVTMNNTYKVELFGDGVIGQDEPVLMMTHPDKPNTVVFVNHSEYGSWAAARLAEQGWQNKGPIRWNPSAIPPNTEISVHGAALWLMDGLYGSYWVGGAVYTTPYKGLPVVRPFDFLEITSTYPTRAMLDRIAAKLAMPINT
jgi:hypothetical protein